MNSSHYSSSLRPTRFRPAILGLSLMCALRFGSFEPVRANVYPTDIRLNGGMTNVTASSATGLIINYLLNEPASAGVNVVIKSNATTVRTISVAGGDAGTARGANSVFWNGQDDGSNNVV